MYVCMHVCMYFILMIGWLQKHHAAASLGLPPGFSASEVYLATWPKSEAFAFWEAVSFQLVSVACGL